MTNYDEIERLLNQTGRTMEGLPTLNEYRKRDLKTTCEAMQASGIYETFPFIMHQSDVIELLIGALRDALAKAPKWISVEERLPPPETERYLVIGVFPNGDRTVHSAVWAWDENDEQGDWIMWDSVTHWMPLPEPTEEEEK